MVVLLIINILEFIVYIRERGLKNYYYRKVRDKYIG